MMHPTFKSTGLGLLLLLQTPLLAQSLLLDGVGVGPASRFQIKHMEDIPGQPGVVDGAGTSATVLGGLRTAMNPNPIVGIMDQTCREAVICGDRGFDRVRPFRPNPLIVVP